LQKVLSEKKYLDEIPRKTISIDGAHLPRGSQVYISAADVNFLQILNCRFDTALAFSFANVANQIFVAQSSIDELQFYALTAKNLNISDSRIKHLDVRSSNISNSVALESIKSDSISFLGGKAENVEIIGSSKISSLTFEQYSVGGNISFFGGLGAISVKNLTSFRSKVGGALYFSSESDSPSDSFQVQFSTISDFYEPAKIPARINLDGLSFTNWFIGKDDKDTASTLEFLSKTKYNPAIYLKLAESLKSRGNYDAAREILFTKRSKDYEISEPIEKVLNWVSWGTVGYGVKPQIGLYFYSPRYSL
jgi:hypothetical protein